MNNKDEKNNKEEQIKKHKDLRASVKIDLCPHSSFFTIMEKN